MIELNEYLVTIEKPLTRANTRKTLLANTKEGVPRWEWCLEMAKKDLIMNRDQNTVYSKEMGTVKTTLRCLDFISWLKS